MSRPIKFRVWDDKNKKWLLGYEYDNLGGFSLTGEIVLMGEWGNIFWSFISDDDKDFDDLKIMQYIGRKDKNNKEIYEGDIVFEGGNFGIIEWDEQYSKYIIKTNQTSIGLYLFSGEVVGNKFENPELLNN